MLVVYAIDSLRSGGKERQLLELIRGVSASDRISHKLVVFSHEADFPVPTPSSDIHYIIRKFKKDPSVLLPLFKLLRCCRPDILHSWSTMTSVYCAPLAKMLGIKFVNGMIRDVRTDFKPFSEFYLRGKFTFPFSDAIVSNTFAGLRACGLDGARAHCIHNGFDFSRIDSVEDPNRLRKRYRMDSTVAVGMVATFSRYRDWETYIRSAEDVLESGRKVVFFCVGGGPMLESRKALIRPEFRDSIVFTGHQSRVEDFVNMLDIGVLLTNTNHLHEGLSNSLMEFMALGKPVIATDCGGNRELIGAGRSGFLVRPFDRKGLASRIASLVEDAGLRKTMGQAGKEIIKKDFSLGKMTDSYLRLYESLLENSEESPAGRPRRA